MMSPAHEATRPLLQNDWRATTGLAVVNAILVRWFVLEAVHRFERPVSRSRRRSAAVACVTGAVAAMALAGAAMPAPAAPSAGVSRADDLIVVDCLLPGQVRNLGQRTTYVSARRPARIPARDCQIRGGEYVSYDRADLSSALAAWKPLAELGDLEAQVIVGEVYERGLGVAPDYAEAARWYRRAAEKGDRRAQVNLGYLYERGLGVEADPKEALEWYRRAAGRGTTIELDAPPAAPPAPPDNSAEVQELKTRTRDLEASLARLRSELDESRQALGAMQVKANEPAPTPVAPPPAAPPPAALPPDRSAEIDALQQELARRTGDAQQLSEALGAARAENQQRLAALEQRSRETAEARAAVDAERVQLQATSERLAGREAELAAQRSQTDRLGRELASAVALANERQKELEKLRKPAPVALLAGPELVLVEPALTRTRDIVPIARVLGAEKQLVGRATAPAGLIAVTVNDQPVTTNELGVFTTTLPVGAGDSPVTIVAVDRQGKRSEVHFLLRGQTPELAAREEPAAPNTRALAASVDFGSYHALIIGNNDYRYLPDLSSPIADATDLAQLLERRYGFKTTVLLNADRYQILSALNSLRETLTEKDNLLIYYAGHGELDEVNQRGHWLPVDAERDSSANWIPTTAITDILNIMRAKQVMLVVDSCYAGALTRSSVGRLATGMTPEERLHWFKTMAGKRSRTALTSGGIAPVMDAGGGRHSVFAKALLEVLEANQDAIDGQSLHREVAARVAYAAANLRFDQVPEYAPIRFAGHEAGEFFLIPGS